MSYYHQTVAKVVTCLVLHSLTIVTGQNVVPETYPEGFIFAAASSAFQIEGAWATAGKGPQVFDWMAHVHPEFIADRSNPDVAADFYHNYKKDIKLLQDLGFQAFRLSISWSRIFPEGTVNKVNKSGVKFYHKILKELLKRGIQPVVTMHHFDLPLALEEKGGWTSPEIADRFGDYADFLFKTYGDKVKLWTTINEPNFVATLNRFTGEYSDYPYDYVKGHNILRAHGTAFRIYDQKYRQKQNGKISLCSPSGPYAHPKTNSSEDIEATERYLQFMYGWFFHPTCTSEGGYPKVMREYVDASDKSCGTPSRLPEFTPEDLELVKGTCDFISLNYYTSYLVENGIPDSKQTTPMQRDMQVVTTFDPSLPVTHSGDFVVDPEGFRGLFKWLKEQYDNKSVLVTENGYDGKKGTDDSKRIEFHKAHLKALREAIYLDGCDVFGYSVWSFLDSFENFSGYTLNFGLVDVNFNKTKRPRAVKNSGLWFQNYFKWLKTQGSCS